MTATRTHEQILNDISAVPATASAAEQYEQLAALWREVARLAGRDGSPGTAVVSAALLADQYARDAKRCRDLADQYTAR